MVELDDAEARAVVHVLGRLIRDAAVAGRPTPNSVLELWRRLDHTVSVSSTRQPNGLQRIEFGVSRIGTRQAAAILGRGERWVQRHAADLDGEKIGERLVFDERTVREYGQALRTQGIE